MRVRISYELPNAEKGHVYQNKWVELERTISSKEPVVHEHGYLVIVFCV